MNNSLPRLIDGMIGTLRESVLPHLADSFARGQVFGVIYMLNSIRLRASWSSGFIGAQLQAQADFIAELAALALPGAPMPQAAPVPELPDADALLARRDATDAEICALIDWLAAHRASLSEDAATALDTALLRYLNRQLRHDIATSARPMFEEISRGAEAGS